MKTDRVHNTYSMHNRICSGDVISQQTTVSLVAI